MSVWHTLSSIYYQRALRKFLQLAPDFRQVQLRKKAQYQSGAGLQIPLNSSMDWTQYADYEEAFFKLRQEKSLKWIPTSGSTDKRKWIPYNRQFIHELNMSIDVLMGALYREYPGICAGTHYWSLSWLPTELRGQMSNDDSQLLTFWKRQAFQKICPTPREVEWAKTSEEAWWHLLTYLVKTKNLTFSSIWSPTYWLEVAKSIESHWSELKSLRKDVFDGPEAGPLFFQKLWPQLQVISCWDSGPSARFVGELQSLFPNVKIHSKGVWSTEAAVTLPIRDKKVLAFTSHYFEFLCLENQKIVKGWDLQPGQRVAPLLWTASGLRNYLLGDQLRVTEIWNGLPCFEFEGRLATADLVGEKIDESIAASLIQEIEVLFQELEIKAVPASLVANAHLRRYELAIVGSSVFKVKDQLDRLLERRLCESHHYQLARDLSQLKPATVCFFNEHKDIAATYLPDAVKGQVKVQQLITYQ